MTLTERFYHLALMVDSLQSTNSLVMKKQIIQNMPNEMKDDVNYVLEILAGYHKFGFSYVRIDNDDDMPEIYEDFTIKQYISQLNKCNLLNDYSTHMIALCCSSCRWFSYLVEPIVNRTFKLGIGKSMLPKSNLSAMLGKSYEGQRFYEPVFVTEKLDGNRCIAQFDGIKWNFTSRNGKQLKVNFDMTGLPTDYIYDGEVLSRNQTEASCKLMDGTNTCYGNFNTTSGLINSKYGDKSNLVYNIFDIMEENLQYKDRRKLLDEINAHSNIIVHNDWRIIPILAKYNPDEIVDVHKLLDYVTSKGAEGLMINTADGFYEHKRTNNLLKYKKVKTMDLTVVDIQYGTGKYEGLVGSLECVGNFDDKFISVQVGSGLSDAQRFLWSLNSHLIIGKIVEIAYFSECQNKNNDGTSYYSLRFPRLKCVRDDKTEESKY